MSASALQQLAQFCLQESLMVQVYEWYAKTAKKEGYESLAAFWVESGLQKRSHLKNLYRILGSGKQEIIGQAMFPPLLATNENVAFSAQYETDSAHQLLQIFEGIKGEQPSHVKLRLIAEIKMAYASRLQDFNKQIVEGTLFRKEKKTRWICRKCGFVCESTSAPQKCPACDHAQAYFEALGE